MKFYIVEHQDDSAGDGRGRYITTSKRDAERELRTLKRYERQRAEDFERWREGLSDECPSTGTLEPMSIDVVVIPAQYTATESVMYFACHLLDGASYSTAASRNRKAATR